MKKRGFTLIELLAVIVILAIIAVITVPKIADMISSSRQGGAEDSFYGTLKAAELGYTKALQSNTNLKGSTCTIEDSKITCANGVKIDVSGKTPESGTLVIDSAGSTMAKALTLNGYKCYGDLSTSNPCVKSDVDVVSETLVKKVTTSGDGLYKDTYEEGRYIFRGINPNNFLTFNNELWKIVSIEIDGTLKVIKNNSVGDKKFDGIGIRTTGYCSNNEGIKNGCNAWAINSNFTNQKYSGNVDKDSELNIYLNGEYYKSLSTIDKSRIQTHKFGVGSIIVNNSDLLTQIKNENSLIWEGNLGLISVSDYLKANSNYEKCGNLRLNNSNYDICKTTNWIFNNVLTTTHGYSWLISPSSANIRFMFVIQQSGRVDGTYGAAHSIESGTSYDVGVLPSLYLKSNIQIEGSGTESDPYKIK